ncbi:hypothetical protein V8C86DRAFT_3085605 [Haematococcus lacustris]
MTVEVNRCQSLHSPAPAAAAAVEQGRLPSLTQRSKHSALGASEARPVLARPAKSSSTGLPRPSQSAHEKEWSHSSSLGSCPRPNGPTSPTNPGPWAAALAEPSPQSNRSGPLVPSPAPLGPGSLGPSAGEWHQPLGRPDLTAGPLAPPASSPPATGSQRRACSAPCALAARSMGSAGAAAPASPPPSDSLPTPLPAWPVAA